MDLLEVKGLTKRYKNFTLQDITFSLPAGYIMGYIGQNGAGKTTTLHGMTHLIKVDSGEVTLNGITYREDPVRFKEMIGYIGDETYFPTDLNAGTIRKILKDFYPSFKAEQFDAYLQQFRLDPRKKIGDYSRGMKVRLMFAAALSRDTKLLILDEATNGLDPIVKEEVLCMLQEYIEDGSRSVLFSTHILSDLEEIADYICLIDHGRKILMEEKETLREKYVLVKGGAEELHMGIGERLIGLKQTLVGFEGLMESDDTIYLPKTCTVEQPTLQQIMLYCVKDQGGTWNGDH